MANYSSSIKTQALVEGALCIALSVILSSFKIFRMPQGGSITLEMLPLLFFAYRRGAKWGIAAGGLSGFLQIMFGGFFAHPIQVLLDYPIALGCMGLGGLFKNHKIFSTILAGTGRLLCHVLSGVVFFSTYAPIGQNIWLYSLIYNATFLLPSLAISMMIAWILWKKIPLEFR